MNMQSTRTEFDMISLEIDFFYCEFFGILFGSTQELFDASFKADNHTMKYEAKHNIRSSIHHMQKAAYFSGCVSTFSDVLWRRESGERQRVRV